MATIDGVASGGVAPLTQSVSPTAEDDSSTATAEPSTTDETPAVQLSLSEEAQEYLTAEAHSRPGQSGYATAHRARAMLELEEFTTLSDRPFGQIVSTLAREGNLASLLAAAEPTSPAVAETGDAATTEESAEDAGTDPTEDGLPSGSIPTESATELESDASIALAILEQTAESEDEQEATVG